MVLHRPQDPRLYQIAVLGTLVCYGIGVLDFGIHWYNALAIATTALAVQWIGSRLARLPSFDPRSPMITALSLILLLRTDVVLLAMAAAAIAIGSKFLLRFNGKPRERRNCVDDDVERSRLDIYRPVGKCRVWRLCARVPGIHRADTRQTCGNDHHLRYRLRRFATLSHVLAR